MDSLLTFYRPNDLSADSLIMKMIVEDSPPCNTNEQKQVTATTENIQAWIIVSCLLHQQS